MKILLILLSLASFPWVLDALFRFVEALWARKPRPWAFTPWDSLVVLVPSRAEGERVRATLASVLQARGGKKVRLFLILDGPDEEARQVAEELGEVEILEKPSPGPSKSAVLRYAAEKLRAEIAGSDGVMVLDVGSRLLPDFFSQFAWPCGADAVQAPLCGEGSGPGEAASFSEKLAQGLWDQGRQSLGWSVRLRGTGTLFRPATFLQIIPKLVTQIEDTEASLLIAASGGRTALLPWPALVVDQKPSSLQEATSQRARWLAGQLQILRAHGRLLLTLTLRRPLEGLTWFAFFVSRPLSLTLPLRLVLGSSVVLLGLSAQGLPWVIWGGLVAGSAFVELFWLVIFHPKVLSPAVKLVVSWLKAVPLVFQAWKTWHRGRG